MSVTTGIFDLLAHNAVSSTEKLAETAAKIAISNFQWRYFTLIVFNTTMFGVEDFLTFYDKSAIITTSQSETPNAANTEQFVIFGQDIQDITNILDWLRQYQYDNTGRYIVICESEDQESCDQTEAINTLWYHKITNVVFIKFFDEKVAGYTYFYSDKNCAMSEPFEMQNLEHCLEHCECDLYPEKFQNLRGCPLIVSTFQQPPYMNLIDGQPTGCDGDLLMILAEALNGSLRVMTPHRGDGWGSLDPKDGTWLGSLADLYYDLANFSITSAALTQSRFETFQTSYNYNFVIIGWVTSPTHLEPSSLKLLHPFQTSTHFAVDITFLSIVVITLLIRSSLWIKVMRKPGADSQTIVFYSWMICMGLASNRLPQKSFFLYMTFFWVWYTFLVRTMYQASLINSLKSNIYSTNIDTVEQAISMNYKIGGGHALRDYFINYPFVYDKFNGLNATEIKKTLIRIKKGEKTLIALNLESINTFLKNYGGSLHIVPQRILVSPTAIFFKKFSPLADPVDLLLRRLFEAGIPDKLYQIYVRVRKNKTQDNREPMRMEHYAGCYFILGLGWAASAISFFFEICCGVRNKL